MLVCCVVKSTAEHGRFSTFYLWFLKPGTDPVSDVLGTPEVLTSFINVAGSVPSRRSVAETATFLEGPPGVDMSIFYESLDYADVVPSPPNFNLLDPLLKRWYGQLWSGDITADELVAGAHAELQAEMDKIKA
jgi:hypothetical protein